MARFRAFAPADRRWRRRSGSASGSEGERAEAAARAARRAALKPYRKFSHAADKADRRGRQAREPTSPHCPSTATNAGTTAGTCVVLKPMRLEDLGVNEWQDESITGRYVQLRATMRGRIRRCRSAQVAGLYGGIQFLRDVEFPRRFLCDHLSAMAAGPCMLTAWSGSSRSGMIRDAYGTPIAPVANDLRYRRCSSSTKSSTDCRLAMSSVVMTTILIARGEPCSPRA